MEEKIFDAYEWERWEDYERETLKISWTLRNYLSDDAVSNYKLNNELESVRKEAIVALFELL